jgi:hypothetical protein
MVGIDVNVLEAQLAHASKDTRADYTRVNFREVMAAMSGLPGWFESWPARSCQQSGIQPANRRPSQIEWIL